ncbi:hypothetical protein PINS_up007157 [Pythium insidiosum]|nr:hypothetical protein PINS_up007157 [Pythium insidiosum]
MADAQAVVKESEDQVMKEPKPERERPLSKQIVRLVINETLRLYEGDFGGVRVVHDGMSAIYAPRRLPWTTKEYKEINPNASTSTPAVGKDGAPRGRGPPTFNVRIKEVESIPLSELEDYYTNPEINPQRVLQALDVVARHLGTQKMIPVGRNLFSMKSTHSLQGGKELCWGYHQSIRIGQRKLLLNMDQAATVFYAPGPLIDLAVSIVRARNVHDMQNLDDRAMRQLHRSLRKLEVLQTHRSDRKKPIVGLSGQPADALMVEIKGHVMSVADYFAERYNNRLRYPFLPAVNIGSKKRETWLPMELCTVAPGQRCANINENDTAEIIRQTSQKPRDRQRRIMDQLHETGFQNDPYLQEFGMKFDQRMETVQARILDAPEVQYNNVSERPANGAWNLRDRTFVFGAKLSNWGVVVEPGAHVDKRQMENFIQAFCRSARDCGMQVINDRPPIIEPDRGQGIEELMHRCVQDMDRRSDLGPPQLIMVIKRDKGISSYGEIKRVSDTVLGIPSQCIVAKNTMKASPQYCANVCLKVNMKLHGKNSILRDPLPLLNEAPTIVIGADVQHPRSGVGKRPSIASVVASLDRYSTKYIGRVAAQYGNDLSAKLPQMMRELFLAYYQHTGRKPEKILYYRDGVSEGQFFDILRVEMRALRRACLMMEDNYCPPVTFMVVNKRHHMRAFGDRDSTDRNSNIVPGTILDTGIVDSHRFDFFLYGHSGIQGTSCPAHYTVLLDENKLAAEEVQRLTYHLCYTFQRCTRSVSVVPPVYYAHLAAGRARFFVNEGSDGASTVGSYSSNSSSFEFADLHKNLLNCMFFI